MQQYREIKARHPDTILFFRMGDFYEMFEDDAQLAARELGLTAHIAHNGGAAEVPSPAFPSGGDRVPARLMASDSRVAICEQVEVPSSLPGGELRVILEHLVEVTHPEEQDGVGVSGLDLAILLHQRVSTSTRGVMAPPPRTGWPPSRV